MFGIMDKLKKGIQKTHSVFTGKVKAALSLKGTHEEVLEQLEEELIKADIGVSVTTDLIDKLRKKVKGQQEDLTYLYDFLKEDILEYLPQESEFQAVDGLKVVLVLGVNGSGKTTSIAKLAERYTKNGQQVVIAAGDTFRAAAINQLDTWAKRVHVPVVKKEEGSDPGAVVYEALDMALAQKGCAYYRYGWALAY